MTPANLTACLSVILPIALVTSPAAAASFAGGHVEAIAGFDRTDTAPGQGARGVLVYGIGVGYDLVAARNIRLGVEGEWHDSTGRQTVAGVRQSVGRSLYAGLRAGVVIAPRLLGYLEGGYVNGRFLADNAPALIGNGWRAGVGGEFAVTSKSFVSAEYRFSNYGQTVRGQDWVAAAGLRF